MRHHNNLENESGGNRRNGNFSRGFFFLRKILSKTLMNLNCMRTRFRSGWQCVLNYLLNWIFKWFGRINCMLVRLKIGACVYACAYNSRFHSTILCVLTSLSLDKQFSEYEPFCGWRNGNAGMRCVAINGTQLSMLIFILYFGFKMPCYDTQRPTNAFNKWLWNERNKTDEYRKQLCAHLNIIDVRLCWIVIFDM